MDLSLSGSSVNDFLMRAASSGNKLIDLYTNNYYPAVAKLPRILLTTFFLYVELRLSLADF